MTPRSVYYYTDAIELGGAERVMLSLVEHLDRAAWSPTLLCRAEPGTTSLAEHARSYGARVILVPEMALGPTGAREAFGLVRRLRRDRPEVFHAHLTWPLSSKFALAAAAVARVPAVVATAHAIPTFVLDRSNRLQLRLLARRVDAYIALSNQIARELEDVLHCPRSKLHVIPNGVSEQAGAASANPSLRGTLAPDGTPIVLTAVRLVPDKGVRYLVEAAVELPDAMIVVAGEGPERAELEALAHTLGVSGRVRFLGHRADIADLVAVCDVFVLPTLWECVQVPNPAHARAEIDTYLPMSMLEAMVASKPAVMTRLAVGDAIVDEANGLHVPPRDAVALAATLRRLLDDEGLRRRIGAAGAATVHEKFRLETNIARTEALYRELLGDQPSYGNQAIDSPPRPHS